MKKLVMTAAILGLTATGAMAQSATQEITLNATVPAFCSIDGGATGTARTASLNSFISNGVITDAQTVVLSGSDGAGVCNNSATITLTSANAGLRSAATPPSGDFVNRIDYTADVTFGGVTESIDTTTATAGTATGGTPTAGANAGAVAVVIKTVGTPSGKYLMAAADYTDTLTVTITPDP